jgi:hypothetical protein
LLINVAPNDVVQRITGSPPRSLRQFFSDYRQRFR